MSLRKKLIGLVLFVLISGNLGLAQKFRLGANVGYTSVKYSFTDQSEPFREADFKPISTVTVGVSGQFLVGEYFAIGSGIQYLTAKGQTEDGIIDYPSYPGLKGSATLDVDNAYLIIPFELIFILKIRPKAKPFLAGGVNFIAPLKQYFLVDLILENNNSFYSQTQREIQKDQLSEFNGFVAGAGVIIPLLGHHELVLRLNYRSNKCFYLYVEPVSFFQEERMIKVKTFEISLGYSFY